MKMKLGKRTRRGAFSPLPAAKELSLARAGIDIRFLSTALIHHADPGIDGDCVCVGVCVNKKKRVHTSERYTVSVFFPGIHICLNSLRKRKITFTQFSS